MRGFVALVAGGLARLRHFRRRRQPVLALSRAGCGADFCASGDNCDKTGWPSVGFVALCRLRAREHRNFLRCSLSPINSRISVTFFSLLARTQATSATNCLDAANTAANGHVVALRHMPNAERNGGDFSVKEIGR